jgi:hypothetical protein
MFVTKSLILMNNNQLAKIFIPLALILASLNSWAAIACEGDYKRVGVSSFSVWFWDVYDIELKTPDGKYQPGKYPLELALTYKRDIDKDDLVSETKNQWQRFNLDPATETLWLAKLSEIWPDVKENDRITFRVCEDNKTQFFFNDKAVGAVTDENFANYFSMIWLDPKGPYPKQVKRLTGQ